MDKWLVLGVFLALAMPVAAGADAVSVLGSVREAGWPAVAVVALALLVIASSLYFILRYTRELWRGEG